VAAVRRFGFVAAVFGALLAGSLPLYLRPGSSCRVRSDCVVSVFSPEGLLGVYDLAHPRWLEVYWVVALVPAITFLLWWYRRAGELRRAAPAVVVTVLLAGLTAALTLGDWPGFRSPSAWFESARLLVFNGGTPLLLSAVALLLLAVGEKRAGLLLATLGYAVVAYFTSTYDSLYVLYRLGLPVDVFDDPSGIRQLVNIAVPAGLLLVGGAAALLSSRTARLSRPSGGGRRCGGRRGPRRGRRGRRARPAAWSARYGR
jgi:hypothetical protein